MGPPGTSAVYRLEADLAQRPDRERENRSSVVEFSVTFGPVERTGDQPLQWLNLAVKKLSGARLDLWLLLDRLPGRRTPRVARYVWTEPQWEQPLEYVHAGTGEALLPRMGLWSRGWPSGLSGPVRVVSEFPERVRYLGHPFRLAGSRADADAAVPDPKVLRLDPQWMVHTVDGFRYRAPPTWRMSPEMLASRYAPRHYDRMTADDLRQYMELGVNVLNEGHVKQIDLWRQPVFVYDASGPWPELLYRSNFVGYRHHLDEPTALLAVDLLKKGASIADWTPSRFADAVAARTRHAIDERSAALWRALKESYDLGDLPAYVDPIRAWDALDGAWYVMAAGAGGLVVEGPGLYRHARTLPYLNMAYRARIPHTVRNRAALATAILRGAARNFEKNWGIGLYDASMWSHFVHDMDYAYRHGATRIWLWGGWPNIDLDTPHPYKLAVFEELQNIARRHGRRDMRKLLHLASVAIVLPRGYTMGVNGSMMDMNGHWMHGEVRNEQGVKIGQVLHNAYVEAERLLRRAIEFDVVVDDRLRKTGYDEYVYILADGRVRVERGGDARLLEGPRTPRRPDLGPGPTIRAEFVRRPRHPRDPLEITATVGTGTGDVAVPHANRYFGQKRKWRIGAGRLHFPDGHAQPFFLELEQADATGATLRSRWTLDALEQPGRYRIWLATIDEFARSAETWLDFMIRPDDPGPHQGR